MTVHISYLAGAGWQFFDNNGVPLTGGKLYTYAAGTTTPTTTYTSNSGATPNTNPIILDSAGRTPNEIWLTEGVSYKFLLKTSTDVQIGSYDNISGVNDVASIISSVYANFASTSDNAKGDALIGFKQSDASGFIPNSVARTVNGKLQEIISVKDFGAVGDGATDDSGAINAALVACPAFGTVVFPPSSGAYLIANTITVPSDNITIDGQNAKILAKAATNFEYCIYASGRSRITIMNLNIDANQVNRVSTQNVRFCGIGYISCVDSNILSCVIENTLGYSSVPAVCIGIGGNSVRCTVSNCALLNGGALTKASDGVFSSGANNLIIGCQAYNCLDTAFVIESSNGSGIVGCVATGCGAAGAITNAVNTDKYGNFINGLSSIDTTGGSGVTGQIQIGCPVSTSTGNLFDTLVSNVVIANVSGGTGAGPGINVRKTGSASAQRVLINGVKLNYASTQGILVDGSSVSIKNVDMIGAAAACIQIQSGVYHHITGCNLANGTFGVVTTGTSAAIVSNNVIHGQTIANVAATDTSTIYGQGNTLLDNAGVLTSKASGAALNLVNANLGLQVTNAAGSATGGSIVNKIQVFDSNNNSLGYIPIYSS